MPAWAMKIIDLLVAYAPWIMTVLGPVFMMKYKKAKKKGEEAVDKLKAPGFVKDLLNSLDEIIEPVVHVIWADYVKALKEKSADGKLTAEEIKEINKAALDKFTEIAPKQLMDTLKAVFPPEKLASVLLDLIKAKVETVRIEKKAAEAKKEQILEKQGSKDAAPRKFFAPPDKDFTV